MDKLLSLVNELESKIPHIEKINLAISKVSVGWHIEHAIMVPFQVIAALGQSDPRNYRSQFNLSRMIVFTMNKIPRGKGKAPKHVQPIGIIVKENLQKDIQVLKTEMKKLDDYEANNYFKHPYFGNLNLKRTIKMLKIHTKHHIDIIDDIIKACD